MLITYKDAVINLDLVTHFEKHDLDENYLIGFSFSVCIEDSQHTLYIRFKSFEERDHAFRLIIESYNLNHRILDL